MGDDIQSGPAVNNVDANGNTTTPVEIGSNPTNQPLETKSNKKIWIIVGAFIIGVILIVALFFFWTSGDSGLKSEDINNNREDEIAPECGFPAIAEKQTPVNREETYFCCSEGIDMQRDALKIKTCYLEDGIIENRHLIWFIFDESSEEYILEKESREENGIYCTYHFSPEGQITGRIC